MHALPTIFRAKFRDAMAAQALLAQIRAAFWQLDWNVPSALPPLEAFPI